MNTDFNHGRNPLILHSFGGALCLSRNSQSLVCSSTFSACIASNDVHLDRNARSNIDIQSRSQSFHHALQTLPSGARFCNICKPTDSAASCLGSADLLLREQSIIHLAHWGICASFILIVFLNWVLVFFRQSKDKSSRNPECTRSVLVANEVVLHHSSVVLKHHGWIPSYY